MSRAVIIARGDSSYAIEGVLDFDSVASLVAEGERMLSGSGRIDVDLGAIREANSAGLALVLEWMDMARRRRRDLRLHNLPESLMRLASLANVSGLLPLADA